MWTYDEVVEVLGQERASVFCEVYGVKQGGNCTLSARSDPHQEFVGKNVLAEVRCAGGPLLLCRLVCKVRCSLYEQCRERSHCWQGSGLELWCAPGLCDSYCEGLLDTITTSTAAALSVDVPAVCCSAPVVMCGVHVLYMHSWTVQAPGRC